jgi:hypothetical protein
MKAECTHCDSMLEQHYNTAVKFKKENSVDDLTCIVALKYS